ncbi:Nsun6 protein [Thecamonas trahens ATCC 50062]|uniref:Nsun6 protein n=1 Tax=Thecamonas trahens ATCC 50062 TaxID=461836 RepID=A0A0L0DHL4_THETB|nr:Nsun6 protein [Thecamonas trahens ATCC 50062]KNC51864.1 Nsun6 protein [Thecamonas trahens ATCC 50062]|eukprot:XP_013755725.1 Nsun6 protein [Thecamonas trahens ATCC 50062]
MAPKAVKVLLDAEVEAFLVEVFGAEYVTALLAIASSPPSHTTVRVNTSVCSVPDAQALLEAAVGEHGFDVAVHSAIPDVLVVRDAAAEKIIPAPEFGPVVVDRRCGESVLRGGHVYIPGVLRAAKWKKAGDPVSVFAELPNSDGPGRIEVFIGNGTIVLDWDALMEAKDARTGGLAVTMDAVVGPRAPSLHGLLSRELFAQNLPSTVVAHAALSGVALDDRTAAPLRVLDMCAAPGGKTSHIAQILASSPRGGHVWACERAGRRVDRLRETIARLDLDAVCTVIKCDSAKLLKPRTGSSAQPDLALASFDVVLLDPQCSGLGLRPRFNETRINRAELSNMADYQAKLASVAAGMVAPGGVIVYSTCTIDPLENEGVIAGLLSDSPHLSLVPLPPHLCIAREGLSGQGLADPLAALVQRFDPVAHDSPAFFVAKLTAATTSAAAKA